MSNKNKHDKTEFRLRELGEKPRCRKCRGEMAFVLVRKGIYLQDEWECIVCGKHMPAREIFPNGKSFKVEEKKKNSWRKNGQKRNLRANRNRNPRTSKRF